MIITPITAIEILRILTWPLVKGPLSLAEWVALGGGVVVCMVMAFGGRCCEVGRLGVCSRGALATLGLSRRRLNECRGRRAMPFRIRSEC